MFMLMRRYSLSTSNVFVEQGINTARVNGSIPCLAQWGQNRKESWWAGYSRFFFSQPSADQNKLNSNTESCKTGLQGSRGGRVLTASKPFPKQTSAGCVCVRELFRICLAVLRKRIYWEVADLCLSSFSSQDNMPQTPPFTGQLNTSGYNKNLYQTKEEGYSGLFYHDHNLVSGSLEALLRHLVPTVDYYPDVSVYIFLFSFLFFF